MRGLAVGQTYYAKEHSLAMRMVVWKEEEMDPYELAVLRHYTDNGKTQIAMIPQYAVPPGETWSIDFVGIDLRNQRLLFIEVSSAQTPSDSCIKKLRRREEWIPVVRQQLAENSSIVNAGWGHLTVAFVIDSRVAWLRERLDNPSDVAIEPLSRCFPDWLTGTRTTAGEPRQQSTDVVQAAGTVY